MRSIWTDVEQWKADALADGWVQGERKEQYIKERFYATINLRPETDMLKAYCNVSIWGPDDLHIPVSYPYSWGKLQESLTICTICGKVGETVRLAFCNRVCPECRAKNLDEYERPGWCD